LGLIINSPSSNLLLAGSARSGPSAARYAILMGDAAMKEKLGRPGGLVRLAASPRTYEVTVSNAAP
jgi:hypothetical protein